MDNEEGELFNEAGELRKRIKYLEARLEIRIATADIVKENYELKERIEQLEAENIKLRGVLNEMRCRRGKCAVIHGLKVIE